jgi:hypothetical protein
MTLKFEVKINRVSILYSRHGFYHKKNNAAIIWRNGTNKWYQYGKFHRDDGPAVNYSNGEKYWVKRGIDYDPEI